uniref:Uncharacterized protein n=1 Tax=Strigamia maritima TaxID=126957 RepID=T1JHD8_STRMM
MLVYRQPLTSRAKLNSADEYYDSPILSPHTKCLCHKNTTLQKKYLPDTTFLISKFSASIFRLITTFGHQQRGGTENSLKDKMLSCVNAEQRANNSKTIKYVRHIKLLVFPATCINQIFPMRLERLAIKNTTVFLKLFATKSY